MTAAGDEFPSLWRQYLQQEGLPLDTPMPASLEAKRAEKQPDGVKHCRQCGGIYFTGTMVLTEDGAPVWVMKPQRCVGCGAFFQNEWRA